ncbi:MAG: helix-turn-helix domain-containing protein [Firmicutes bacterium]|nr:helix-turn-helix domain-containing protein [Bacillota bacterium]
MDFSQKLKELRQSKNLTREQLAQRIDFDPSIIGYWERGQREPASKALKALAIFFDVTTDYLLGLEDEFGAKIKL